jgi:hypothetical protein
MDTKAIEKQNEIPFMENFITQMRTINQRLNSLQQRNFELSRRSGAYEEVPVEACAQSEQEENNVKGCLINELNQIREYLTQLEERTSELETFI